QALNAKPGESWQTAIPEPNTANHALGPQHTNQLRNIQPGEDDSASWFKACVATAQDNTVRLLDHHTGEKISSHTIDDSASLTEDLQWVAEFYHDSEPAVGLRIADTFTAMTKDGHVQQWQIPVDTEINVYGTTPVLHDSAE